MCVCVCVCLCVSVCGTCVRGFNQLIKFAFVITVILIFGMSQKLFECPNLNGRLVVIWKKHRQTMFGTMFICKAINN